MVEKVEESSEIKMETNAVEAILENNTAGIESSIATAVKEEEHEMDVDDNEIKDDSAADTDRNLIEGKPEQSAKDDKSPAEDNVSHVGARDIKQEPAVEQNKITIENNATDEESCEIKPTPAVEPKKSLPEYDNTDMDTNEMKQEPVAYTGKEVTADNTIDVESPEIKQATTTNDHKIASETALNDMETNEIKQETTPDENSTIQYEHIESTSTTTEIKVETPTKITSLETLGPFIASKDNANNTVYINDFPEICKQKPCILGVDEAGRGPVLGPMVYGIAFCPIESQQALIDLGCADSKQLTEEKRDAIFNEINTVDYARDCIGWAVELISPNVISTSMNRRSKCSLNEVSMNSAIGLINMAIETGVNIAEVYVDTVGPSEKYQEKLKTIFPKFKITVAKKADSTYPIVSAASICAKVTRDHALKVWKFPEGLELTSKGFGSGYPGDPVTKQFLTDNIDHVFGFPRLVRFSWSTAEHALANVAYEMEFDEPDVEKPKYAGAKLTQFFKGQTKNGEEKRQQCRFFKERFLQNVTEF